jgi:16S rRNA (uracil1498-N3)-methyltransferase
MKAPLAGRARHGALRVPIAELAPGLVPLPPDAASYVTRVHRLRAGDSLVVFDPHTALEADAVLVDVGRRVATLRIEATRPASVRPTRSVTLIQCVGKGDKMDAIARDATELGATHIVPAISERSIGRPSAERAERWRRIAVEAARQCGRGDTPRIDPARPLAEVIASSPARVGRALCLHPRGETSLAGALAALGADEPLSFLVGPEGGLADQELDDAERCGFRCVTLGPLVLRTETVCAAVLGALLGISP